MLICVSGVIMFSYLTDFIHFPLKNRIGMLQEMVRTGQQWTFLKGDVDRVVLTAS